MKKRIRIQGFLIFLSVVTFILLSKFLSPHWESEILDELLDALGIGLVLFGFLFRIAARGYKAEISPYGKKLITLGPYSIIRHPMYLGTLLIGLGIIVLLFKWWILFLFFTIFLLIYIPQIRKEEDTLYRLFGDEYKNYCKSVPKHIPSLRHLFTTGFTDYLFLKWGWVKKELVSLILVVGTIMAIETWQDVNMFGYREFPRELSELSAIIISFVVVFALLYGKEDAARTY